MNCTQQMSYKELLLCEIVRIDLHMCCWCFFALCKGVTLCVACVEIMPCVDS